MSDPIETCAFCGKTRDQVGRLVTSRRPSADPVAICNECIDSCNQLLADEAEPVYFEVVVDWNRFEVDGIALEWSANRSLMDDERVLMLHVRHAGQEGGVGHVLPVDTDPTEEHARATARIWLDSKKQ